jgi:hypothetical protein
MRKCKIIAVKWKINMKYSAVYALLFELGLALSVSIDLWSGASRPWRLKFPKNLENSNMKVKIWSYSIHRYGTFCKLLAFQKCTYFVVWRSISTTGGQIRSKYMKFEISPNIYQFQPPNYKICKFFGISICNQKKYHVDI